MITSGGTREPIDQVRFITNLSGGRLGAKIADEFAGRKTVSKVYFVCARSSDRPTIESDKIEISTYTTVEELQEFTYRLLREKKIDVIIHAAAVSDYKVEGVYTPNGELLGRSGKISSSISELMLKLVPTPKVISQMKQISPDSRLVGFKFLVDASLDDLFAAANKTLKDNNCIFVLANRLMDISKTNHVGYIVSRDGVQAKFDTKAEIAKGIADYLEIF
jgi:phosphopantothenate-cysteine ligase